jgi:hypothetical protein
MRKTSVIVVLLVVAAALLVRGRGRTEGRTLIAHDFSTSAQGWVIASDTGEVEPIFEPRGGHPGGYISAKDEEGGETWYFRAPASVLAQLAAAEYGRITYSVRQSEINPGFPDDDIVIVGAAGRLSYRFDHAPGTEWTTFSAPLEAAGWHWNWNMPATQEQMRSVLAHPIRLDIRGEYRTGTDVGGLDTFALTAR